MTIASGVVDGGLAPTGTDAVETYAGGSGLQYLGDGWWQYNWHVPKSYAGQTRVMTLQLDDNSSYDVYFRFK